MLMMFGLPQVNDLNLGNSTIFDDPATELYPMWVPPNSVITMHSADPTHCILLRMFMQHAQPVTVFMQQTHNMDHVKLNSTNSSLLPTATSPRGTNLLHPQQRRFYLTVCGGFDGATSYLLRVEERVQVSVTVDLSFAEFFAEGVPQQNTIEETVEVYERTTGLEQLVNNMATLLEIPQSSIKVACVHAAGQPCIPLELMLATGGFRHRGRVSRAVDPTVVEFNITAPNPVENTGDEATYQQNLQFLQGVANSLVNSTSVQLNLSSAVNESIAESNRSATLGGVSAIVPASGIGIKAFVGNDAIINNSTQSYVTVTPSPTAAPVYYSPTTIAPTSISPTTVAPTTVSPTTVAPTSVSQLNQPTTISPTTSGPTTISPTTHAPVTFAPTTLSPTQAPVEDEVPAQEESDDSSRDRYTFIVAGSILGGVLLLGLLIVAIVLRKGHEQSRKLSPVMATGQVFDSYVYGPPRSPSEASFAGSRGGPTPWQAGQLPNALPDLRVPPLETAPSWVQRLPVRELPTRPTVLEDLPSGGRRIKVSGGDQVTFSPLNTPDGLQEVSLTTPSRRSASVTTWEDDDIMVTSMV